MNYIHGIRKGGVEVNIEYEDRLPMQIKITLEYIASSEPIFHELIDELIKDIAFAKPKEGPIDWGKEGDEKQ